MVASQNKRKNTHKLEIFIYGHVYKRCQYICFMKLEHMLVPLLDVYRMTKVRQAMKRYIQVSFYDKSLPKYNDVLNNAI